MENILYFFVEKQTKGITIYRFMEKGYCLIEVGLSEDFLFLLEGVNRAYFRRNMQAVAEEVKPFLSKGDTYYLFEQAATKYSFSSRWKHFFEGEPIGDRIFCSSLLIEWLLEQVEKSVSGVGNVKQESLWRCVMLLGVDENIFPLLRRKSGLIQEVFCYQPKRQDRSSQSKGNMGGILTAKGLDVEIKYQELAEFFMAEQGLVIQKANGVCKGIENPVLALDFFKEKNNIYRYLPANSVVVDFYSMDWKEQWILEKVRSISYFSVKNVWKQFRNSVKRERLT